MIKMLLIDVDGVLTDGSISIGDSAEESKTFNVKDGMGIALARKAGISVVFLSARYSKPLVRRAKELGVEEVHHSASDKAAVLEELTKKHMLKKEEVAYIGDDINDIPALKLAGLPCAVNDAAEEVKSIAKYVSKLDGGKGAVREIIEMILKAENAYDQAVKGYLEGKDKRQ